MRTRLVDLCLLAYPRDVRAGDGEHLRDLATDLAEDHGALREALGLVRGGLLERARRRGRARRAAVAVVAAVMVTTGALTWTAAAQGGRVDEEVFSCAGQCPDAEAEVAARVRDGWTCTERTEPTGSTGSAVVAWRCTRG